MNRRELFASTAKAAAAAALGGAELAPKATTLSAAAGAAALTPAAKAEAAGLVSSAEAQATKPPNIVMLMTDDTGWNDFGCYSGGGAGLGHPTPNVVPLGGRRRRLHQLVRAGELHCGPRLVHHWAHPDSHCPVNRHRARRPQLPPKGDADHRRVLSEERLLDLLLRQVASWGHAQIVSDRARLRRDEAFRGLLRRRLRLQRHRQMVHPWFPSFNPEFEKAYDDIVNLGEWEVWPASPRHEGRHDYL